jgi:molybdopterin/thiamine biosynthesis adenylyltransferase
MKRTSEITSSAMGRSVNIRMPRQIFNTLADHLRQDPHIEQFAFILARPARTADGTILIVQDLLLPDDTDLQRQSAGDVLPTRQFEALAYYLAEERRCNLISTHTHVHPGRPHFSGIDESHAAAHARYVKQHLPPRRTYAMMVFGNDAAAHDAIVYDRSLDAYRQVDYLEILGSHIEIRPTCTASVATEPQYSRQLLIPGWDQLNIARQRVAIVGCGGNGAQAFQTLLNIGAGSLGWIALIDPDVIEASNRPRIPYAFPEQDGIPKVTAAACYAGRRNPSVAIYPYPCSVTEEAAISRIKAATVLVCAPDNDGVRKVCNNLAVRYCIPMIEMGCEIQADKDQLRAGGQVRVVLPGENACLVCSRGYDPAQAAVDLADDEQAIVRAAAGYVRGSRQHATPSVTNLNTTIAQLAVNAFLALVSGTQHAPWAFAHFDQLTARTLVAQSQRLDSCPHCGPDGVLGAGDELPQDGSEPAWSGVEDQA